MPQIIDLSSNNPHPIDYRTLPVAAGIVKATEGTDYSNPYCGRDVRGLRGAGKLAGVYHFLHPEQSVEQQIEWFGKHLYGSRLVVIDSELNYKGEPDWDMTPEQWKAVADATHLALELAAKLPGVRTTMLYSSPDFALPGKPWGYREWIADYGTTPPPGYTLWQYTDRANVAGVKGLVDLSRSLGDERDLKHLFGVRWFGL